MKQDVLETLEFDKIREKLAELAGTIPYELICAVSKRVPRYYLEGGDVVAKELLLRM